jgi:NAD(P)-dependent dehydrogenase (short-subunit alcohol dehydrogenase family)
MKREVVVITGASAGIGRATAMEFARHGAQIGLIARGLEGLQGAQRDVEALGGTAMIVPADVSDFDAVDAAATLVEERFGPIDVWVNNAMTSIFSPFMKIEPEEYKRVTEVTYLGTVYGTHAALKRMQPRDRGTIVQVGSALAYRGIPLQSAYCGAKHAIQGFMDSLRCELLHANSGIHVCMVQMPGVNTPQFEWVKSNLHGKPRPLGSCYQPEVAAEAVYFAAHSQRREIYVGVPTVEAVVGNKISPALGDWYLSKVGFDGQQRDEPDDPRRPNNLWEPVPRDFGAHGPFDAEAKTSSLQLWADKNRGWLALAGGFGLSMLASVIAPRRKPSRKTITKDRSRRPAVLPV